MVDNMMQNLAQNYPVGDYLFMGDFNLKTSSEAAWQSMTNSSYSAYNFVDPINTPGSWNNSSTYANIHTGQTHTLTFKTFNK
jgi:endonuclease/exonuclease/phosphatase family metal-dependent hydrolase